VGRIKISGAAILMTKSWLQNFGFLRLAGLFTYDLCAFYIYWHPLLSIRNLQYEGQDSMDCHPILE